jgi:hypothetical protein
VVRHKKVALVALSVNVMACPNENVVSRQSKDDAFKFGQPEYHSASSYSSTRCRSSGNLSWLIGLRDDILRAKCGNSWDEAKPRPREKRKRGRKKGNTRKREESKTTTQPST